jgi:hypothetical protein
MTSSVRDRNRKRLQGAREHGPDHFYHRNSTDQIMHRIAMRFLELVDMIPNLALKSRLETSCSSQHSSGGYRSSANKCASATELSRIDRFDHAVDCSEVRQPSVPVCGPVARARPRSAASQPCRKASNNSSSEDRTPSGIWWANFRNNAVTIRDQNRFATGGEPDILAELIFERLKTDRAHTPM